MKYRLTELRNNSDIAKECFEDWISKQFRSKSLQYIITSDGVNGFFDVIVFGINYFSHHSIDELSHNRYFRFFGFYIDFKHINFQGTPIRFMFRLR